MRRLIFPCLLSICAACAPLAPPATELSTPYIAPKAAATGTPTSTAFPSPAEILTLLTPTPVLMFGVLIDSVAIGPQGQLFASGFGSNEDNLRHFAGWDGSSWTELGTGFRSAGNAIVVDAAGRLYTAILKESTRGDFTAIIRWNGDSWQDITGNFSIVVDSLKPGRVSSNIPVTALALDGDGNLYAGGMFNYLSTDNTAEIPMGYVAMWNGDTWAILGEGFDRVSIFALAATKTGDIYVSGEQPLTAEGTSGYIAEWHGMDWAQINAGNPDVSLHLAIDQSQHLFAAGQRTVGGAFIDYLEDTHRTTIADQFEGEAPAIFDMAVDSTGLLCVGGEFESVNGVPARNIACWNGAVWHPLAGGVDERVFALAFDTSGGLYAAGYFTEAGGQPANHIARWDGERWHTAAP